MTSVGILLSLGASCAPKGGVGGDGPIPDGSVVGVDDATARDSSVIPAPDSGPPPPATDAASSQEAGPATTATRIAVTTVSKVSQIPSAPPALGSYRVHLIDVGTGLSVFVQGHDFSMLFDGGSMDDASGGASNRVMAYLGLALGLSGASSCTPSGIGALASNRAKLAIDHVILSHPHTDHDALLPDVLSCYDVQNVWDSGDPYSTGTYASFLQGVTGLAGKSYRTASPVIASYSETVNGTPIQFPSSLAWTTFHEGDVQPLGVGASFKVLHADGAAYPSDANLNSTVLRVDLGGIRMILTGDGGSGTRADPSSPPSAVEQHLLANFALDLRAEILQVGHHGSMTSSRTAFLNAVSPKYALVGVGPHPYASVVLPDQVVIDAVTKVGATILRTDVHDIAGCPSGQQVGVASSSPGGCDNFILDITP